jgi:glycosyltransferase involved in cell wall biosynthesis
MPVTISVLILGKLPPPIGGVTMSIKNLVTALLVKGNSVAVFPSGLFCTYDIAHAHNYQPWKRFLMLLLGNLLAKKSVFTIHGMHFREDLWLNKINLWLADGIIVQNELVLNASPSLRSKPILKIASLVHEGIETNKNVAAILGKHVKPRLLLYAQHSDRYEGQDIYGVPFVMGLFDKLKDKYTLVLADVNNSYPQLVGYEEADFIRIDHPVNFTQLLSEIDFYIRPTCKDGDSVAVLEAIMLGVPVVASDVAERRPEVTLYEYGSSVSFINALEQAQNKRQSVNSESIPSVDRYLEFYQHLLVDK